MGGRQASSGGYTAVVHNALVESFALHARNMVDFFYNDSPQPDDAVASQFFSNPLMWQTVRPPLTADLQTAKARANKEISHLTYARLLVAPSQKSWPVDSIVRDIDAVLATFCENADLLPERVKLLRYRQLLP